MTSKMTLTSTSQRYIHFYHKNRPDQWKALILVHKRQFFSCLFVMYWNMFVVHTCDLKNKMSSNLESSDGSVKLAKWRRLKL